MRRLSDAFLLWGYEGVSLSRMADHVGLAKATLYHHFPSGKAEMGAAVLALAGQRLQRLVLAPLQASGPATGRLITSFEGMGHYYNAAPPACVMNMLATGDGAKLFGADILRANTVWRTHLARTIGAWAEEAQSTSTAADPVSMPDGPKDAERCMTVPSLAAARFDQHEAACRMAADDILDRTQGVLVRCRLLGNRQPLESEILALTASVAGDDTASLRRA